MQNGPVSNQSSFASCEYPRFAKESLWAQIFLESSFKLKHEMGKAVKEAVRACQLKSGGTPQIKVRTARLIIMTYYSQFQAISRCTLAAVDLWFTSRSRFTLTLHVYSCGQVRKWT